MRCLDSLSFPRKRELRGNDEISLLIEYLPALDQQAFAHVFVLKTVHNKRWQLFIL